MTNKPARYDEWLAFVFEHPNDRDWYFDDLNGPYFEASSEELVDLITYTCLSCGKDLLQYSEAEVKDGLNYIFNNSCSNVVFCLMDKQVPTQNRLEGIQVIKTLYKDCFKSRCAPVLMHMDSEGANPLNSICFMLWDVMPFTNWGKQLHKTVFYDAAVDVLEYALTSSNIACIESALHGLGHMMIYHSSRINIVISNFLQHHQQENPMLRAYAEIAARGAVY